MKKSLIDYILIPLVFLFLLSFIGQISAIELNSPTEYNTIQELIKGIVGFLRNLALVITPLIIILAGYYFVTSAGDPKRVSQAQKMILYAVIGLAIILMAQAIITLIEKIVTGK